MWVLLLQCLLSVNHARTHIGGFYCALFYSRFCFWSSNELIKPLLIKGLFNSPFFVLCNKVFYEMDFHFIYINASFRF